MEELAKKIIEIAGSTSKIVYDKPKPSDVKHGYADIIKTISESGWRPKPFLTKG